MEGLLEDDRETPQQRMRDSEELEELRNKVFRLSIALRDTCIGQDDWRGASGKNCPYKDICAGDPEFECGK